MAEFGGLDFGAGTDLLSGGAPVPDIQTPQFNFQPPNFAADFNLNNLAGASPVGKMYDPLADVSGMTGGGTPGAPPTPEKGWLDTTSDYAKKVAPVIGVGTSLAQIPLQLSALSQTGRAQKAMEGAVATEREAAAPAIAAEQQLLPAGTKALLTGDLPPELQAAVDDQVNQWTQQQLSVLTAQGIDQATARAMIQGQADELRNSLTIKYAESLMAGGEGAAGTAGSTAQAGGTIASVGASQNPLQAANQALARLSASA